MAAGAGGDATRVWVTLPLVATAGMRAAGVAAALRGDVDARAVQVIWTFALAAAPTPPREVALLAADGWRVAPLAADRAMLRAGGGMVPGTRVDRVTARLVWDAMAARAPAPPRA